MKKNILIITERRADYSKFKPILNEIKKSNKLDYFLIVTGSHLLKEYGLTINEIKKDGFTIHSKFQMYDKKKKDTGREMVDSLGRCILKLSQKIEQLKPHIILSGFDLGSNLAVALVGAHMNIPVVHVEGGEITGTIDDPIRHAISRFAHIHFVTNSTASDRLIKMGEDPKSIHIVGNTSIDSIKTVPIISKKKLEDEFKINLAEPLVIVIQHTVTSEVHSVEKNIQKTLNAIKELKIQAILIHGNADAGSQKIFKIIKKTEIKQYSTLSFEKYVNLLKYSSALVGNSSSGIMESPFLHVPSVNIGTRQSGRLQSICTINVDYDKNEIKSAITKAISNKYFQRKCNIEKSLYGEGDSAKKIIKILEKLNLQKVSIQKKISY
jgi:GDP/UDP-N,N'-diacetylbacillosamine 2-epimerase (hydrolysing)